MISPLKKLHKAFSNPATGTFAWVGVENAESYEMISGGIHVSLHGVIC